MAVVKAVSSAYMKNILYSDTSMPGVGFVIRDGDALLGGAYDGYERVKPHELVDFPMLALGVSGNTLCTLQIHVLRSWRDSYHLLG